MPLHPQEKSLGKESHLGALSSGLFVYTAASLSVGRNCSSHRHLRVARGHNDAKRFRDSEAWRIHVL